MLDGETSPLLGGTPTPTLHDSDSDSYNSQDPRASVSWLIPVVVMATLSTALTTYSRHVFFRQFVCEEIGGLPSTPDPPLLQINGELHPAAFSRLDCSSSPYLSGSINAISMIAACILSALSTGWWSRLGDVYGRRYALMVPVIGSILLNVIFTLVAGSPALEGFAQPCMFIGLLVEGLLGGSATFNGAVHAYAADVSFAGSWSSIFSVLQGLFLLCSVLGNWIGMGTDFFRPFLSFGVSAALGLFNLAFIFFFLPESLPEEFQLAQPLKLDFKDITTSIYSNITIFSTGQRLAFFGLAFFIYSLTSSVDSFQLLFVLRQDLATPAPFSASFFITLSLLGRMATVFIIFPAMLYLLKRRSPLSLATSTKNYFLSVMAIDRSAARYSVFADFFSQLLIIVVPSRSAIFFLLAFMTPLTVGIKPALYALSAVYSEVLGGASRRGALFGALSVVGMVGETLSYVMYVSTYNILWRSFAKAGFMLTAALLALVAIFLWPGEPERFTRDTPERIRIIVSDTEAVDHDPSSFSPVYRRHGINHAQDGR
ncbi:hypothetical protein B0H17DRAFT_1033454 [Mycena rosella]|uniref:Major facilitator superfamily (MFS) profile domain-containing protein n=1 Tax=Mycena rosella TaxID=1033263 RepID=A0AAD7MAD2_MYCRO|nr:hypothetical protein B0H17DRAFT_1033454 [Mycena rosella]